MNLKDLEFKINEVIKEKKMAYIRGSYNENNRLN